MRMYKQSLRGEMAMQTMPRILELTRRLDAPQRPSVLRYEERR